MRRLLTSALVFRVRTLLIIGLLAVAGLGFGVVRAQVDTPVVQTQAQPEGPSSELITTAVNTFLRDLESPLADQVAVQITAHDGNFVQFSATPNDLDAADVVTGYAELKNGAWTVLNLGTAFAPEDCAALGVPAALPCQ